ncbi:uncharacterized protein LOC124154361 [Ischnura elegans]|uniref:uncharacterized protein LOC124154361 n=1 Tax=Ischnura elegans TaxID=197161 RepID=UPI001ED88C5F|nr:uncharacterized protein LOC124154361 [Ischnura elegans]
MTSTVARYGRNFHRGSFLVSVLQREVLITSYSEGVHITISLLNISRYIFEKHNKKPSWMTMLNRHFIIIGIFSALFAVAATDTSPTHVTQDPAYKECKRNAKNHLEAVYVCMDNVFLSLNETRRLRNDTICVKCAHTCRKQDEIKDCMIQGEKNLVPLSNRSKIVIPIIRQFLEEGLTALCEIESSLSHVFRHQNDSVCLRQNNRCLSLMRIVDDDEHIVLCDSSNPKYNYTDTSVLCRGFNRFLECVENSAEDCSTDGKRAVASIKSQLRNMPSCSEFLSRTDT